MIDLQPFIQPNAVDLQCLTDYTQFIVRDILTLLTYPKGAKIYDRLFGSEVLNRVFDNLDDLLRKQLESDLTYALSQSQIFDLVNVIVKRIENKELYAEITLKLKTKDLTYRILLKIADKYVSILNIEKVLGVL